MVEKNLNQVMVVKPDEKHQMRFSYSPRRFDIVLTLEAPLSGELKTSVQAERDPKKRRAQAQFLIVKYLQILDKIPALSNLKIKGNPEKHLAMMAFEGDKFGCW